MKWKEWLDRWSMSGLEFSPSILEAEWDPQDRDRNAAWDLYVELLTRVSTQYLSPDQGDEKAALESIRALFGLTRETLKTHGPNCQEFAKIAIVVLNQIIRPFAARWHKEFLAGAFDDEDNRRRFREDLIELQCQLRKYTKMLGHMAKVEDLTDLEKLDS